MKEMDGLTVTDNQDYRKSPKGFHDNNEIEDDIVIIQLIVQGRPITVNEHLLAKYSNYFWNLFQNLPPLTRKKVEEAVNEKIEEEDIEETLVLKHNSASNVWNNEFENKKEDPLSRIAYETMESIIDFLYKLDQQQSKNEEENGKEENFSRLKVYRSVTTWLEYTNQLEEAKILLPAVQWHLLEDVESIKNDRFLTTLIQRDKPCKYIIEKALQYHDMTYDEQVAYWRDPANAKNRPSRWPKLLTALCYADKLIECYDFEESRWFLLTERPGCAVFGAELCYVPSTGKLYTIGGVQSKEVGSYCIQNDEWKNESKLNQFRVAHGVVSDGDHIHVVGGSASASDVASFGVGLTGLEVMDMDEIDGFTWKTGCEMNEGRNYAGTYLDNDEGKIYVVAGCLTKKTSTAEVYNMSTSKWTKIANTLIKRDSLGLISIPRLGQIFGIGGYNNRSKEYLTSTEKYIPDINKWVSLEQKMKVGRRKPGVVNYRGRIYVVGGMGKDKDLNSVQVLNPVTEEWEDDDEQDSVICTANNKSHKGNGFVYVPPLQELCDYPNTAPTSYTQGWMSCCLIDKPLRLMKNRMQDQVIDCSTCREISLDLCKKEENCTNQCSGERIANSNSQAGNTWSAKTERGSSKSSLPQCNNTRTLNIECQNARTGLRMKQRKEFQTGSGL